MHAYRRLCGLFGLAALSALSVLGCAGSTLQAEPTLQAGSPSAAAAASTATSALVPFDSAEGRIRLERSQAKADFFRLANQFEAQEHLGNCGPTSAVIVLNALRGSSNVDKPVDDALFPEEFRKGLPPGMQPVAARYTQGTFLDARFEKVKPRARFFGAPDEQGARDPGLQLRQLHEVLLAHGLASTLRVAGTELDAAAIERELRENLARDGDFVLANYNRPSLGQPGGGHISPLGAYDETSRSVLVLDVNPSRAPWVWVPIDMLIEAMRAKDMVEPRGYLLLQEGAPQPSLPPSPAL